MVGGEFEFELTIGVCAVCSDAAGLGMEDGFWVSLEKEKLMSRRRGRRQFSRDGAAAVGRNRQRQGSVAKGRQGVVVMLIAKQSGVAGCRGRADAPWFVVTMSTTLLVRTRLEIHYHTTVSVSSSSRPVPSSSA